MTTGVFQAVYVYTPEVFSTNIRAAALGVFSGSARVGAIVTPYVAQVRHATIPLSFHPLLM